MRQSIAWFTRCVVLLVLLAASALLLPRAAFAAGNGPDTTFSDDGFASGRLGYSSDNLYAAALQADGKLVAVGTTYYRGGDECFVARYDVAGDLDPAFANAGQLIIPSPPTGCKELRAVAIQPDGKILVAGSTAASDFLLLRYSANGTPDLSFDGDGRAVTDFGASGADQANSLLLQADGKIILTGQASAGAPLYQVGLGVARYNPDGSLDASFDSDGRVTRFVAGNTVYGRATVVQSDGKLVVGSYNPSIGRSQFTRYNSDGSLDTSFNGSGSLPILPAEGNNLYDLRLQSDGKLVAALQAVGGYNILRFNADGTADTSFDGDGRAQVAFPGATTTELDTLLIQPDGKIVAGGRIIAGTHDFGLARLNANGSLDTSFDGDGRSTVNFSSISTQLHELVLHPDGRLTAVGSVSLGSSEPTAQALARLTASGGPDITFGEGGRLSRHVDGSSIEITSVATLPNGKTLVAGPKGAVRYNADGTFDETYGNNGRAGVYNIEVITALALPDGKTLFGGLYRFQDPFNPSFAVTRLDADGQPDPSFGGGDFVTVDVGMTAGVWELVSALAVQPDGKIILAGWVEPVTYNRDFAVVRLNANGSIDTSFSGDGIATSAVSSGSDIPSAVVVTPNGRIFVGGNAPDGSGNNFWAMRVFDSGGNQVGGSHLRITGDSTGDHLWGLTVLPDGKVIGVGTSYSPSSSRNWLGLMRYNDSGNGEASNYIDFGAGVYSNSIGYAAAVQADGKLLVAGRRSGGGPPAAFLARFNALSLDPTFGTSGVVNTDLDPDPASSDGEWRALTIMPDTRIVLAGRGGAYANPFTLARFQGDNPPPSATPQSLTTTEDTDLAVTLAGSDPDNEPLTFRVTQLPAAGAIYQANADGSRSAQITAVPTTVSDAQRRVIFAPAANDAASRSFAFVSNDGRANSLSATVSVTITPVNDAPVVTQAQVFNLTGINEDTAANPGNTVLSLLNNGAAISDPDAAALKGIAVVGTTGVGAWQHSLDGVAWSPVGPTSDAEALLLTPAYRLRFVPDPNWNGTAALTFRAWDQTSGTLGSSADVTVNGGDTAFGATTASTQVVVTAVNDAPVAAPGALTLTEDQPATGTLSAADIDSPNLTFSVVAQPARGSVTITDAATGAYSYTPSPNAEQPDSFTFRASDGSLSSVAAVVSVTITPVNDAPALDAARVLRLTGIPEDAASNPGTTVLALLDNGGAVSDPDVGAQRGIAVTGADSPSGVWQFSTDAGATWQPFASPSAASARLLAADSRLRFVPALNWNGSADGLLFRAWDRSSGSVGDSTDTSVSGGTSAFSTALVNTGVTVAPVNDAPVATPAALSLVEDQPATAILAATDVDSAALTYAVVDQPLKGVVAITDAATGAYSYTPFADVFGDDRFTFRASDGLAYSAPATVAVTIAPANDAPRAWPAAGLMSFSLGDKLSVADAPALRITGDLTLEAWVNPTPGAATGTLVGKGAGEFALRLNDRDPADGFTQLEFAQSGASFTYGPADLRIPVGRWTHVAVVRNAAERTVRFYLNGNLLLTRTFSAATAATASPLLIGDGFSGLLDDVRLWATPRTRAQLAGSFAGPVSGASSGLRGSWRFDEASGPAALSSAPGGLQASILGAARVPSSALTTVQGIAASGRLPLFDPDGDALAYRTGTAPAHGTVDQVQFDGAYTYTPVAGFRGDDGFSIIANDGALDSAPLAVSVSVSPVNAPPTIGAIADQSIAEGVAAAPVAFTIADDETAVELLSLAITSSNPALLPEERILVSGLGASRTLSLDPLPGTSGTSVVTLTVSDGAASASASFTVAFTANAAPTISAIADQNVVVDTAAAPVAFTIGDAESAAGTLTVTASSSDQALLPDAAITLGGAGAERTLAFTLAPGQTGTATVELQVNDGVRSATTRFLLNITAAAGADPALAAPATAATDEDAPLSLALTLSDVDTDLDALVVTAESDNPALTPATGLVLTGTGAARTLTITPQANRSGATIVTVRVSDGERSASRQIAVTVRPVNDPPTVAALADQTIAQDTQTGALPVQVDDVETPSALTVSATSDNLALIPASGIVLSGSGASRSLVITPQPYRTGTARITVTIGDGQASATTSFVVTVAPAGRAFRTFGALRITADGFTVQGGGAVARGNVWIGDHLTLSGADDSVTVDLTTGAINGSGTVTLLAGNLPLLQGPFSIDSAAAVLVPSPGATSPLTALAGFSLAGPATVAGIDVTDGVSSVSAELRIGGADATGTARANLSVAPGPVVLGELDAFSLPLAGAQINVPTGAALSEARIAASRLTLTLPTSLGGGAAGLSELVLTPGTISLGATPVALADLALGGPLVTVANPQATLQLVAGSYQLALNGALTLALPGNGSSRPVALSLAGGQLSGALPGLDLAVGGGTLSLATPTIDNSGLVAAAASYSLPPALGGASTFGETHVAGATGLHVVGGRFAMPTLTLPGASTLSEATAAPAPVAGGYVLNATGKLHFTLPENDKLATLPFTLGMDGRLAASLDGVTLDVAGTRLALDNLLVSNSGLAAGGATLTMPASLGGGTGRVGAVSIGAAGLSFAGTTSLALPDASIGSTIALSRVSALLGVEPGAQGDTYLLTVASQLDITLPGNSASSALAFTMRKAGDGAAVAGSLDQLALRLAGGTLTLNGLAFSPAGFAAGSASYALPPALGGSAPVGAARITGAGLELSGFTLPELSLAGGRLRITGATAAPRIAAGAYALDATGTLRVRLPENDLSKPLPFVIDGAGELQASLAELTLNVAGTALRLEQSTLGVGGLDAARATITLPTVLGGGSAPLTDARIDGTGLNFGDAGLNLTLPNFQLGAPLALSANQARLEIVGDAYRLAVSAQLALTLPGNSATRAISYSIARDESSAQLSGALEPLDLRVAGGTLSLSAITLSRDGLAAGGSSYALPRALGGSRAGPAALVGTTGLSFVGGQITLPDLLFSGDGSALGLFNPGAELFTDSGAYGLRGQGDLRINLIGGNSFNARRSFSISGAGQLSSDSATLSIAVAGSTLSLPNLILDNNGARSVGAVLTLPARYGSPSGAVGEASITRQGLRVSQPSFVLGGPLSFGRKLWVDRPQVNLSLRASSYSMLLSGLLNADIPGNKVVTNISFQVDNAGTFKGEVDQIDVKVAGGTLALRKLKLVNTGLWTDAAALTIRGSTGTARDLRITGDGLQFGAGTVRLATNINLAGPKAQLLNPEVGFLPQNNGYGVSLGGDIVLNLPQNSQTLRGVRLIVDSNGGLAGEVASLRLRLGQVDVSMARVQIGDDGFFASRGELSMPASLGGAAGIVNDLRINGDGLSIGGAGARIPIPNFTIGSESSGVAVSQASGELLVTGDYSYSFILAGKAEVRIPGSRASATGTLTLSNGGINGTLRSFTLSVAGMGVQIDTLTINNGVLTAERAGLRVPDSFGGASVDVYNLRIASDGLSIGGGKFDLPSLRVGKFQIGLKGELRREGAGYLITAAGSFQAPNLGGATGCSGIAVSATIYTDTLSSNGMAVDLKTPSSAAEMRSYLTLLDEPLPVTVSDDTERLGIYATPASFALRQASLTLSCQIPIGTTGLFLTKVEGSIALSNGVTRVSIAVEISAGKKIADIAVLSATARATLVSDPFEIDLSGVVKVFIFEVGGANANIKPSSFRASLWIDMKVIKGNATVRAWTTNGSFKFTGSGRMEVGARRGEIWEGCAPIINTPCVKFPPFDTRFGNIGVDVGAFKGDRWGARGWISGRVPVIDVDINISGYADTRGTITFGNGGNYQLEEGPAMMLEAQQQALRATSNLGIATADLAPLAVGTVDSPVVVAPGADPVFQFTRLGDAPWLTIVDPSGNEITPANLPANIHYGSVTTYTIAPDLTGVDVNAVYTPAPGTLAPQADPSTLRWLVQLKAQAASLGAAALPTPRLRLVGAAPGAPALDLLVDNVPTGGSVGYGAAGAYSNAAAGVRAVKLVAAGTTAPVLAQASLELVPSLDYTLALAGRPGAYRLVFAADNNRFRDEDGRASVRLLNTSGLGALTVSEVMGKTLFSDVAAGAVSDYRTAYAPAPSVEIVASGAPVAELAGANLAGGRRYTLLVAGEPGAATAIYLPDSEEYAQLRLVNGLSGNVDLRLGGSADGRLAGVATGAASLYATLRPGTYSLDVVPSAGGAALATTTVTLAPGGDYSLVGFGAGQAALLTDDNQLPTELGTVRVRLVNAGGAPLALTQAGGAALTPEVAPGAASSYVTLPTGAANLALSSGGSQALALNGLTLDDGDTISLMATGSGGSLQAALRSDLTVARETTEVYAVQQAQPGTWLSRYNGVPTSGPPTFVGLAVSLPRPPALGDAQATSTGQRSARASWRLTSTQAMPVNVYATTVTPEQQTATGDLLRDGVLLPSDGSAQSADVDLSRLPSGTYYLYVEAGDGDMPSVRAYAPQPVQVVQSWAPTWVSSLQATPGFRSLGLSWQPHPSADAASYVVTVRDLGVGTSQVITTGVLLEQQITNLSPGTNYRVSVRATDEAGQRIATSTGMFATPLGAPFELAATTPALTIRAGSSAVAELSVRTTLAEYPEVVGLRVEGLPAGLSASVNTLTVVPVGAGAPATLTLTATATMPSGVYPVTVVARGPGLRQTSILQVTVQGRGFAFLAAGGLTLQEGGSVTVSVPTEAINGGSEAPILLALAGAPAGLDYSFAAPLVAAGQPATLTITDTELLSHGDYTLQLQGSDGPNSVALPIQLTVAKPGFELAANTAQLGVAPGQRGTFAVEVRGVGGWTTPVSVSLDSELLPAGVQAGLFTSLPGATATPADGLQSVEVAPGGQLWVVAESAADLPDGLYVLRLDAASGARHAALLLRLQVTQASPPTPPTPPATYRLHLPLIHR